MRPVNASFGVDLYSRVRLAQLLSRSTKYDEALHQLDLAGACKVQDPELMPQYYRLLMNCADHLGDKNKAKLAARAAILSEEKLGQSTGVSVAAKKYLDSLPKS